VAHGGKEGRLGLVGLLCVALGREGRIASLPSLVVRDLQPARQILLLVGQGDVVVLPAVHVAHIGHQMADIGRAGDADELVEGPARGDQDQQQRCRRGHGEGVEGGRMGRADRHRRRDGGQQHQSEQHALQLELPGRQQVSGPAPAGAPQEGEAGEPPAPAEGLLVVGSGTRKIVAEKVEAQRHAEVCHERSGQLDQVDLPPVDGRDHRPEDKGKVTRRCRSVEQASHQLGADEPVLAGGRLRLVDLRGGGVSGGERHQPSRN